MFGQLVDIVEEWGASVLDPNDGKEIIINRDGKGLNTKYSAQISPKTYIVPPSALAKLNDIDAYVRQESDEQQRRAIAAVNGVAGLLPAGTSGDRPQTTPTRLAAPSSVADDVETIPSFTSSNDSDGVSMDAELDDLLNDLA